mmetsp:Transcript_34454/g.62155  ORF Transcript_34454/g.62155 Transcript_34454/m.62155 type:complete len:291 (+) Transcript_34454:664-1536(+)
MWIQSQGQNSGIAAQRTVPRGVIQEQHLISSPALPRSCAKLSPSTWQSARHPPFRTEEKLHGRLHQASITRPCCQAECRLPEPSTTRPRHQGKHLQHQLRHLCRARSLRHLAAALPVLAAAQAGGTSAPGVRTLPGSDRLQELSAAVLTIAARRRLETWARQSAMSGVDGGGSVRVPQEEICQQRIKLSSGGPRVWPTPLTAALLPQICSCARNAAEGDRSPASASSPWIPRPRSRSSKSRCASKPSKPRCRTSCVQWRHLHRGVDRRLDGRWLHSLWSRGRRALIQTRS